MLHCSMHDEFQFGVKTEGPTLLAVPRRTGALHGQHI